MRLLIQSGIDVNEPDTYEVTALMLLAKHEGDARRGDDAYAHQSGVLTSTHRKITMDGL